MPSSHTYSHFHIALSIVHGVFIYFNNRYYSMIPSNLQWEIGQTSPFIHILCSRYNNLPYSPFIHYDYISVQTLVGLGSTMLIPELDYILCYFNSGFWILVYCPLRDVSQRKKVMYPPLFVHFNQTLPVFTQNFVLYISLHHPSRLFILLAFYWYDHP